MTPARYNAAVDLLERNAAADRARRPYLLTEQRCWSYGEVIAAVSAAACGFMNLGARQGDVVALAMHDRPEFVIGFWGAMRAGLVPLLLPPALAAAELEAVLAQAAPRIVVCDRANALTLESLLPTNNKLTAVSVDSHRGVVFRAWNEVCGQSGTAPDEATQEDDIAFLICSSGTTGAPKLVAHLHRSLRLSPYGLGKQVVALTADDVVLSVSKMSFSYGLGNSVYMPAAVGAATVLLEQPAIPAIVHPRMAASDVTVLYGVPAFYRAFVTDAQAMLPGSLRIALSAGEHFDSSLASAVQQRFGHTVLDGFGTTETLQHVTCNRLGEAVPGSCGGVLDGYEIEVRDSQGQPLGDGSSGELWIAGRTLFAGYLGQEALTRAVRPDRWMRTGDRVTLRNGSVFHEGRLDDLMKLGGRWVSPVEVEQVLRGHRDLADVAVVPRSTAEGAVWLCAFLVSERKDDALVDELTMLCSTRLSSYKVPREWIRTDTLPRTRTGKLRRLTLRQHLASSGA
jgi:acyl-coenzyme A synthetase/AMP-(fatty) acid ligase